ncbi:YodC family protein [Klebsiella sp. MPUS7]|uniref:YodC family protein n=1 Tax=Klebsiella sp. MPUS7 TaxID=2697371 RepID=UPI0013637231|nr:DUF2158 domain-containing protein [Klebsiella sp. MPUS7]QHI88697.1 DUF2158 domain-containing protein [Klebsiella sp. MPUS7]
MSRKFEDGAVVQLKSGGPLMTVSSFNEEYKTYHCEWFAGNDLQSANFYEHQLTEE